MSHSDTSSDAVSQGESAVSAGGMLAALCGAAQGMVWFQDRDGKIVYANAATLKMLGRSEAETLGRTAADFDTFEDQGRREAEARIYAGSPREVIHGHRARPDGTVQHYRLTLAPMAGGQGEIAGMVLQIVDETELFQTSKILQGIGAAVPDLVFAKDRDLRLIYANPAFLKASGRTLDSVIGRRGDEIWSTMTAEYIRNDQKVIETGRTSEFQTPFVMSDGVRRMFQLRKFPLRAIDGSIFGLVNIATDVTEDIDARAELARTTARLETINNVTPNIIWSSLQAGKVDFVNEHWTAFTGRDPNDPDGWQAGVHPDDVELLLAASRDADASGEPMELECRLLHRVGDYRWMLARAILHDDPDTGARRWTGSFTDIQELVEARQQMDQALKARAEGEAHLQAILNAVPDPMVVVDSDGLVQAFGAAAEAQFGWPAAEIVGRHVSILAPEVGAAIEGGDPLLAAGRGTWRGRILMARRRDGSTFPFELSAGVVQSGGRTFYTGFVRDQSERLRSEVQAQGLRTELAQVVRLTELSSMASALAHELNQPLSAAANFVHGSARLLSGTGQDLGLANEGLEQAVQQISRASESIRRLRTFLDRGDAPRKPEALKGLIEEAVELALTGAGNPQVRVRRKVVPPRSIVLADRLEIQQVLVHLVRNALDAMAECPKQTLEIVAGPEQDGMARISVRDCGHGLSEAARRQLFQPFVSTKPNGMGVGLSICRAIVEAHGGRIWAEAGAKAGTTFHFTLRIASEAG